jgi:predicted RNase H-related nuclease YkuK (DUF458 family)
MNLTQVVRDVLVFMRTDPGSKFKLVIGTDSQLREEVCYVTAIVILRAGKGGRFYYAKEYERAGLGFKERIFYETSRSLQVAVEVAEELAEIGMDDLDMEIHLDIGEFGKTKEIIREAVGMVTGSGFGAKIKPDSYGAFKVADKYTK